MDNPESGAPGADRSVRIAFGPNKALAGSTAVLAVLFLGLVLGTNDRPGRILYAAAVVVLSAIAVRDLYWNPRLIVCSDGLSVHIPGHRVELPWPGVERVVVDSRSRYGLASNTLEIDGGEQLYIFSRWSLGTDPGAVERVVRAVQPPTPS